MKVRRWLASLGLGLGLIISVSQVAGQSGPMATPPAATPFRIGALSAWSLHDGQFVAANDGKTFGVGESTAAVSEVLRKAGAPSDFITLSVNVLLVKLPGHTALFDSGLGPNLHGGLMASLALTGVKPDEITDILITHSHGDHIGGLVGPNHQMAFPNAAIRMSAAEWTFLKTQSPPLAATIAPKVATFTPGAALFSGVTPIALTGHTPGHVGYMIVSGRSRLLDFGDTAHSSIVSLAKPDWKMEYDTDQELGRTRRHAELAELASASTPVFAPHFPYPGLGKIVPSGDGFVWRAEALKWPAVAPSK